jgi:hypothetical protein
MCIEAPATPKIPNANSGGVQHTSYLYRERRRWSCPFVCDCDFFLSICTVPGRLVLRSTSEYVQFLSAHNNLLLNHLPDRDQHAHDDEALYPGSWLAAVINHGTLLDDDLPN